MLPSGVTPLTAGVAATPLVTSLKVEPLLTALTVSGGVGPKVLANRATALVTADDDDASSCPLLSAAGSFKLSAGARPSGKRGGEKKKEWNQTFVSTFNLPGNCEMQKARFKASRPILVP